MSDKLKDCPFCGGSAEIAENLRERDRGAYYSLEIGCDHCPAVFHHDMQWDEYKNYTPEHAYQKLKKEAIAHWNERYVCMDQLKQRGHISEDDESIWAEPIDVIINKGTKATLKAQDSMVEILKAQKSKSIVEVIKHINSWEPDNCEMAECKRLGIKGHEKIVILANGVGLNMCDDCHSLYIAKIARAL